MAGAVEGAGGGWSCSRGSVCSPGSASFCSVEPRPDPRSLLLVTLPRRSGRARAGRAAPAAPSADGGRAERAPGEGRWGGAGGGLRVSVRGSPHDGAPRAAAVHPSRQNPAVISGSSPCFLALLSPGLASLPLTRLKIYPCADGGGGGGGLGAGCFTLPLKAGASLRAAQPGRPAALLLIY